MIIAKPTELPSAKAWIAKVLPLLMLALILVQLSPGSSSGAGSDSSYPPDYQKPKQLHLGVLNTLRAVNINDARVALDTNVTHLNNNTSPIFEKAEFEILPDVPTTADRIRQKKLHVLCTTGIDYLLLRDLVDVRPLILSSGSDETPLEPYVLLTPKEIDWARLARLENRRLIVESGGSWNIGRIWLETVLHGKGLPESPRFFTAVEAAEKPIRMVLPVFFGRAEACLVRESAYATMVELNPQIGQKLRVLSRSPGFILTLVCVSDFLDAGLVDIMNKSACDLHTTVDGRQIMMIFRLRRNFAFRPEYLINTEQVLRSYQKTKASLGKGR